MNENNVKENMILLVCDPKKNYKPTEEGKILYLINNKL